MPERSGPAIALACGVTLKYLLIRPVVAFNRDTGKVIVVPSGATVCTSISKTTIGLCSISWNENRVSVFREDLERNGIAASEEPFG